MQRQQKEWTQTPKQQQCSVNEHSSMVSVYTDWPKKKKKLNPLVCYVCSPMTCNYSATTMRKQKDCLSMLWQRLKNVPGVSTCTDNHHHKTQLWSQKGNDRLSLQLCAAYCDTSQDMLQKPRNHRNFQHDN